MKIRFVNVVDLFRLMPETEHPHGLSEREFDSLFTIDKPVIFNFHAYASLIHKFTYRRTNHDNFHVRGYKEKGNINTPLELAILNQIDRFNLAIDVIDRVPALQVTAAHTKEWLKDQIIDSICYANENGIDRAEINDWKWPARRTQMYVRPLRLRRWAFRRACEPLTCAARWACRARGRRGRCSWRAGGSGDCRRAARSRARTSRRCG